MSHRNDEVGNSFFMFILIYGTMFTERTHTLQYSDKSFLPWQTGEKSHVSQNTYGDH